MDLPTYTSIWRIEKRLYKLYDFRLPMPVPVGQIAVFTAITVPYVVLLTVLGLPFNHTLFWLYVLPPGVITWLATRPVLESKRLPELIISQVRYLGEPATWCRMTPLAEKDDIVVVGKVWRRAEKRPASPVPARRPATAVRRAVAAPARAMAAPAAVGTRAAQPAPGQPPAAQPPTAHPPTGQPPTAQPSGPQRGPVRRPAPVRQPARPPRPAVDPALAARPAAEPGRVRQPVAADPAPEARPMATAQPAPALPAVAGAQVPPAPPTALGGQSLSAPRHVAAAGPASLAAPATPGVPATPAAGAVSQPAPVERTHDERQEHSRAVVQRGADHLTKPEVATEAAAPVQPSAGASAAAAAGPWPSLGAARPGPAPAGAAAAEASPVSLAPGLVPAPPAAAPAAPAHAPAAVPQAAAVAPAEAVAAPAAEAEDAAQEAVAAPPDAPAAPVWSVPAPAPVPDPPAADPPAPSPWAPPIVVVRGGANTRPTMVERALSGPGQHRGGNSWREHVRVVPGGQGPGRPDMERRDRARVLLPISGPRLIVVLGCTVGAGQTVTTLMLADVLASLRAEPVAALDLNPGQTSLTDLARTAPAATARGLLAGSPPSAPGSRGRGRLDLIVDDPTAQGGMSLNDADYARAVEILTTRYALTLADPGASAVARVLSAADQLILVAPASADAARAVAMTMEWLDGHGYGELCTSSIAVINGVSKRSMSHVEQAELVVRGRCRAIVRVPWDDHLGEPPAEQGIRDCRPAPGPASRFGQLRPQVQHAYTALAGVLVAALAVGAAPQGSGAAAQRRVSR
ncbi:MAG TPA: TcpE family conjugal transfer membrane protein [Streptosporangiaceae bacterium]|nr:TcpE family conjugal transfer membrane protein [Streptosporangiaceae bacterium]